MYVEMPQGHMGTELEWRRYNVKRKLSMGDRVFMTVVIAVLLLVCLCVIYPIYYMLIVSVSDGYAVTRGEVNLVPKGINFAAYSAILSNKYVPNSYKNTIVYTVSGTLVNLVMTGLCAYPLSRKHFFGRHFFNALIVFTMFFDAGIISQYMVVNSLHMRNTIWALIIPGAINVWYMMIMRTFFSDIPEDLFESARLDGANDLTIFVKVVVPLSKAVMATMVLFYAVGHWNAFLTPLIYLDDRNKLPMQLILRNIVMGADASVSGSMSISSDVATMSMNIKYAVIFITILPILVVYPFVQKYFVKGVMVGSVKG